MAAIPQFNAPPLALPPTTTIADEADPTVAEINAFQGAVNMWAGTVASQMAFLHPTWTPGLAIPGAVVHNAGQDIQVARMISLHTYVMSIFPTYIQSHAQLMTAIR